MSAKALLSGVTLPAGQTAEQDLSGVIDSIFNHPNVGPFVCRQLIQHLVSGDPITCIRGSGCGCIRERRLGCPG